MEFLRVPAEDAAVRRYVEELWLPYQRDLEAAVEGFALADDVDLVGEEIEFRDGLLEAEGYRIDVAFEPGAGFEASQGFADADGEPAGFIATSVDEPSTVFERPPRLLIGELWVRADHRGGALAETLVERAVERAREEGCPELTLEVAVDNERATRFYERLGFETARREMRVGTDEVSLG